MKNFILPSGGLTASQLHVARTVCRRAERDLVPLKTQGAVDPTVYTYVNRLSDYLFMLARISAQYEGETEVVYKKAKTKKVEELMHEFSSTDTFLGAFETEAQKGNKYIVLFSATMGDDGSSWCGDCVVAKDHIKRIVDLAAGKRAVLKGVVTSDEWLGNAAHPYRKAPLGASGVPCMGLYQGRECLLKVADLDSFANDDLMNMLLEE